MDYPEFGYGVANAVSNGEADSGIIICGTGIGISIAANRNPKIRAALCTSVEMARLAREHNDANVLALGARITDGKTAVQIAQTFIDSDFEGGRHARRVNKLGGLS